MTTNPLNTAASVKLDGSGNGTVKLGPNIPGVKWRVAVASVLIPNAVLIPQCRVYVGPNTSDENFVDGTYTGNLNSTDRVNGITITQGSYVWAVWAGGDPNVTATLSIIGTVDSP